MLQLLGFLLHGDHVLERYAAHMRRPAMLVRSSLPRLAFGLEDIAIDDFSRWNSAPGIDLFG
jgi:hypothetical protein